MKKGEKYQLSKYRDPVKAAELLRKVGFTSKEDVALAFQSSQAVKRQPKHQER